MITGVGTGYVLHGPGLIPGRVRFSLLHSVRTDSGDNQTSYPMSTRDFFPGRPKSDHSPPSSAEVNKVGAIPPLPHMSSWHSA
jgi:hypothetical protein